jgi:hypothetical protein
MCDATIIYTLAFIQIELSCGFYTASLFLLAIKFLRPALFFKLFFIRAQLDVRRLQNVDFFIMSQAPT